MKKILVFGLLLGLVACQVERGGSGGIVDARGVEINLDGVARRVVSLAPNLSELILDLGLGGAVVGVSDHCPEFETRPARLGSLVMPNPEALARLKPDLLIASYEGNPPWLAELAKTLGLPLYLARVDSLDGLTKSLTDINQLLGGQEREIKSLVKFDLRADLRGLKIFFQLGSTSEAWSFGRPSLLDDLLTKAGLENLGARRPGSFPRFDSESLAGLKPDLVVLLGGSLIEPDRVFWQRHAPGVRLLTPEPDGFERPGLGTLRALKTLLADLE